MTTATIERATPSLFTRITRVTRLHMANPWTTVIWPWIIIAAIFVLTYAIWLIVLGNAPAADRAEVSEGLQYSGASSWVFVYMLVVAVQAMNLTFPLALGYGSTRRDFYLGSSLLFVLLSAMWTVGLTVFAVLEKATDGWGVGGRMFTAIYFGGENAEIWQRLIIYFCLMLFFFFIGAAVASIYVRWKVTGMLTFFIGLGALVVGAIALISYTRTWGTIGQFFVDAQATGIALWLLVPTAIAGIAGYLVLRRATPRS